MLLVLSVSRGDPVGPTCFCVFFYCDDTDRACLLYVGGVKFSLSDFGGGVACPSWRTWSYRGNGVCDVYGAFNTYDVYRDHFFSFTV